MRCRRTSAEAGVPGCEAALWTTLVVPAVILDRLSQVLSAVVNDPSVQQALRAQGADPQPGPPAAVIAAMSDYISKWRDVVKTANISEAK